MSKKTNIRNIEKSFNYLDNPDWRKRELGDDVLVIRDAEISGINFIDLSWSNLHFINCDFFGIYQIKLKSLRNTTFEDCRFAGVVSWGKANNLRYIRCRTGDEALFSITVEVRMCSLKIVIFWDQIQTQITGAG